MVVALAETTGTPVKTSAGKVMKVPPPATAFSIEAMGDRGVMFIEPGTKVYAGQVIGEARRHDVIVASDLPLQGSSRTQTIQMTEAIRKVLDGQSRADSVGLGNVDARLRQVYGDEFGLVVDTAPGAGMRVSFRVPKYSPALEEPA